MSVSNTKDAMSSLFLYLTNDKQYSLTVAKEQTMEQPDTDR